MEVLTIMTPNDIAKFLQDYYNSNDAWAYLLTAMLSVASTTLIMVGREQKEVLKRWQKVSRFFGFMMFACVLSILLDNNKFIALGVGAATPVVYFDFVKRFLSTIETIGPFGTGKAAINRPKGSNEE